MFRTVARGLVPRLFHSDDAAGARSRVMIPRYEAETPDYYRKPHEAPHDVDAIVASAVTKKYGGVTVLRNVTLRVAAGETLVLMGANGAGKTTLLHVLALLREPSAGTLSLFGLEAAHHQRQLRSMIGFVGHHAGLYRDLTATENLSLYAELFGIEGRDARIGELLRHVGLWRCRDQRLRTFSRGMWQRLELARALVHDPWLLLLDEPDTGLDAEAIGVLTKVLRAPRSDGGSRTNVVATHRGDWGTSVADRLVVVERGRLNEAAVASGVAAS